MAIDGAVRDLHAALRAELAKHDAHRQEGHAFEGNCAVCNPEDLDLHTGAVAFDVILRDLLYHVGQAEQLQVQLAGCGAAALGATKHPAVRGDYGWSLTYQDVLELRIRHDRLEALVQGGGWC
jgi:hypothetical protein